MKLKCNKDLKLTVMITMGKTLFGRFWTKRGPNWARQGIFQILPKKLTNAVFSISKLLSIELYSKLML